MQPDADLLHPLPQRIQHGLGPGLGRQCTRRQAVCEAVGGRLSAARSWRSSSKAARLETPRRARSASRVIGCPCWSWYSAAARRASASRASSSSSRAGDGRPGADSSPAPPSLPSAAGRGVAGGAALDHGDRDEERGGRDGGHDPAQAVGCAWERLAARLSSTPPASTTAGHDSRRVTVPCCLSRCRSRAAMTQVRSMQTAVAQAIGAVLGGGVADVSERPRPGDDRQHGDGQRVGDREQRRDLARWRDG